METTNNDKGVKVVIVCAIIIFILILGGVALSTVDFKNIFKNETVNITKTEKEVTVTDEGIADAVSKLYDATVIVKVGNAAGQIAGWGSGVVYDTDDSKVLVNPGNSGGHNNSGSTNNSVGSGTTGNPDAANNTISLAKNEAKNSSDVVQHSKDSAKEHNSEVDKTTSQSGKSESGAVNTVMNPNAKAVSGTANPIWKLGVGLMELAVLGAISLLVASDVRVIMWFEQKKKRK